jgi:hypothetical protein
MVLVPAGARAGNRIPLHIQRGGDSVLITGNLLVDKNPETEAVLVVSEVNQRPVDRAIIANNLCFARSGTGIRVSSSEDVAVEGNLVVATGPCAVGIVLQSTPTSLDRVAARGNDITVEGPGSWDTGILLNARKESPARHVSVVDNSVYGAVEGVRFLGSGLPVTGFEQTPVCALNRVDPSPAVDPDQFRPLVGLDQLPEKAVLVGGQPRRGGSRHRGRSLPCRARGPQPEQRRRERRRHLPTRRHHPGSQALRQGIGRPARYRLGTQIGAVLAPAPPRRREAMHQRSRPS